MLQRCSLRRAETPPPSPRAAAISAKRGPWVRDAKLGVRRYRRRLIRKWRQDHPLRRRRGAQTARLVPRRRWCPCAGDSSPRPRRGAKEQKFQPPPRLPPACGSAPRRPTPSHRRRRTRSLSQWGRGCATPRGRSASHRPQCVTAGLSAASRAQRRGVWVNFTAPGAPSFAGGRGDSHPILGARHWARRRYRRYQPLLAGEPFAAPTARQLQTGSTHVPPAPTAPRRRPSSPRPRQQRRRGRRSRAASSRHGSARPSARGARRCSAASPAAAPEGCPGGRRLRPRGQVARRMAVAVGSINRIRPLWCVWRPGIRLLDDDELDTPMRKRGAWEVRWADGTESFVARSDVRVCVPTRERLKAEAQAPAPPQSGLDA